MGQWRGRRSCAASRCLRGVEVPRALKNGDEPIKVQRRVQNASAGELARILADPNAPIVERAFAQVEMTERLRDADNGTLSRHAIMRRSDRIASQGTMSAEPLDKPDEPPAEAQTLTLRVQRRVTISLEYCPRTGLRVAELHSQLPLRVHGN